MGNPPPLPDGDGSPKDPRLFHQAAAASITLSVVLGISLRLGQAFMKADGGVPNHVILSLVLLGAAAFGYLVSIALGVVAVTAPGEGMGAIRRRGGIGAAVSTFSLSLVVWGFCQGYNSARQSNGRLAEVGQILKNSQREQARLIEKGDAAGVARAGNEALRQIRGKVDVAAREVSGGQKSTLEAAGAYLDKVQTLTKDYEQKLGALQKLDPVNPETLTDLSQLAPRRLTIRAFLDSNQALQNFMQHSEDNMVAELRTRQVPERLQNAFLQSFRKGRDRHDIVVKIRETDNRIGEGMLAVLRLLEEEWGDWNYDTKTKRVLFREEKALERFQAYSKLLSDAAQEQQGLQRRLTRMPSSTDM